MAVVDESVHTDPQPAPASPLRALSRRWPLGVLLLVVGLVAGVLVARPMPTTYTAESRIAVGAGDLTSGAIAGFPLAASELASNYARYVSDQALTGDLDTGAAAVTGSQIPDSNVIRIEASSTDQTVALEAADKAAKGLIKQVNKSPVESSESLLQDFTDAANAWATTQTSLATAQAKLEQLRARNQPEAERVLAATQEVTVATSANAVAELGKNVATARYEAAQEASAEADLVLVSAAQVTASDRDSRIQRFGLLGAVGGLLLALVLAVGLERLRGPGARRRRKVTDSQR